MRDEYSFGVMLSGRTGSRQVWQSLAKCYPNNCESVPLASRPRWAWEVQRCKCFQSFLRFQVTDMVPRIPFAVGAIADVAGVRALQPIILALLGVLLLIWLTLPWKRSTEHLD